MGLIRLPQTMRGPTKPPPITWGHQFQLTRRLRLRRRTDQALLQCHEEEGVEMVKEHHLGILKVCRLANLPRLILAFSKITRSTPHLEKRSIRRRNTSTRRR